MAAEKSLIERPCRCLAFHAVETDIMSHYVDAEMSEYRLEEVSEARRLIAEAGLDFDALYPIEQRPAHGPTPESVAPHRFSQEDADPKTRDALKH